MGSKKDSIDVVEEFIEKRCVVSPGYWSRHVSIYIRFVEYCSEKEIKQMSRNSFYRELAQKGFAIGKSCAGTIVPGLEGNATYIARGLFRQIEEESQQCATWIISIFDKLQNDGLSLADAAILAVREMPKATAAYREYVKNT